MTVAGASSSMILNRTLKSTFLEVWPRERWEYKGPSTNSLAWEGEAHAHRQASPRAKRGLRVSPHVPWASPGRGAGARASLWAAGTAALPGFGFLCFLPQFFLAAPPETLVRQGQVRLRRPYGEGSSTRNNVRQILKFPLPFSSGLLIQGQQYL